MFSRRYEHKIAGFVRAKVRNGRHFFRLTFSATETTIMRWKKMVGWISLALWAHACQEWKPGQKSGWLHHFCKSKSSRLQLKGQSRRPLEPRYVIQWASRLALEGNDNPANMFGRKKYERSIRWFTKKVYRRYPFDIQSHLNRKGVTCLKFKQRVSNRAKKGWIVSKRTWIIMIMLRAGSCDLSRSQ